MITAKEAKQLADKRNNTFSEQDKYELNKIEESIYEAAKNGWYALRYDLTFLRANEAKEHLIIKKLQEKGYEVKIKMGMVNDGLCEPDYLQIDWKND